jgi:hypothetical protein
MATDSNAKPSEINGIPMRYQLEGTTLTDIKLDKKTGWIIELNLKQLMEGNIEVKDNPKLPGGMTIPMSFTTEITTTGK